MYPERVISAEKMNQKNWYSVEYGFTGAAVIGQCSVDHFAHNCSYAQIELTLIS